MSLATIFHGDVSLEQGSDVTQFGWGDLKVARNAIVYGDVETTRYDNGAAVIAGGVGVAKSANVHLNLTVDGVTRLQETHIDTSLGGMSVTGANAVLVQVGASSQFISTGGNVVLSSINQTAIVQGGGSSPTAVQVHAGHSAGGVDIMSGGGIGGIALTSGAGGIVGFASSGTVSFTSTNAPTVHTARTNGANQNLTMELTGATDSGILIKSAGTNASVPAFKVVTTHDNGSIDIANALGTATGLGHGHVAIATGSGGFSLVANTSGPVSLTAQAAPVTLALNSYGSGQVMKFGVNGLTDSSLVIESYGTNVTRDAMVLRTMSNTGNINVSQPELSSGGISVYTGTGGFSTTTQLGGQVNVTANGAPSTYTNATTEDDQNLTVSVTGETNSKVIISSSGTGSGAVTIESNGGIYATSEGGILIDSQDNVNGVQLGTATAGVPVKIGTTSSTTTVYGNLDVKGTVTTIESNTVTVEDNIIIVNSAPSGTSDGGLGVKRFQYANDSAAGDVVLDTPDESGQSRGGNNATTITLSLDSNGTENYYAGWWIKLVGGTGSGQVRRIKSYDGVSKTATIYSTDDQTELLADPEPVEGMDFTTVPDSSSLYQLFPCHYVFNIWDETRNEFALACSSLNPDSSVIISHYADLHVNDLACNAVSCATINDTTADSMTTVTLLDSNTTPVTVTGFPSDHGVFLVMVRPENVDTRAYAVFMIGRNGFESIPGTIVRIISVKGVYGEQLDMQWPAGQKPQLLYRPHPGLAASSTTFRLKIVSI